MIAMLGQHSGAVVGSVALHVAILVALTLTFRWPLNTRVAAVPAPVQGTIVDQSTLKQEQQRRDQEAQRRQSDERQKREAAAQQQREKEAADKRERDRVADLQRQKEQADRDKAQAAKTAQEKVAKDKAAQDARDKQARDDAARKQKDALAAKQKAQAEADLQKEMAAEAARQEAERTGVLDEYARLIEQKIEISWNPPASVKPGLVCVINVVQLPTGDVFEANVDRSQCNGDEAVRLSIEAAVKKASPLPKPPSQAAFERNLIVTFKPDLAAH
jgi:colicin import membrane protein